RMAQSGLSAADVVNTFAVNDLIRIIGILGEERQASRIAKSIVDARQDAKFETTLQLSKVIEKASPRKANDKIHPATRSFQGLRIFVNDELNELARALFAAETILKPGGRLVVVTFHSLEDRIVKRYFQNRTTSGGGSRFLPASAPVAPLYSIDGKAIIAASDEEIARNSRSRSAKLRHGVRSNAAARDADLTIFKLPNLPWPRQDGALVGQNSKRRH
ncbi:MAG: 16S rRNA (cytosine(1402)-N(4))-methyltransferase RsmH, partial [Pseudomonadota bacterium]